MFLEESKIKQYYRYADDILCIFNGNTRQLEILTNYINKIHPNLKFTTETEQEKSINYLDLTLTKISQKISFSIYRKPTCTDQVIHSTSNHPQNHKLAAFRSMVHRLITIPLSPDNFEKEKNIIKQIAKNNGYDPNTINKLIWKSKRKDHSNNNMNQENSKYTVMTYHGDVNNSIHNILERKGCKVVYKPVNNVGKSLSNKKMYPTDPLDGTSFYKVKCSLNLWRKLLPVLS